MPHAERPLRADARRNRELIIGAAEELFLRDGANASLEEMARRAGVGSATLHRHFPTRKDLLEAVYADHVNELCEAAQTLAADHDPAQALTAWLRLVNVRAEVNNGLAALAANEDGTTAGIFQSCHAKVAAAGDALLERAIDTGAVRADVDVGDLLGLASALTRTGRSRSGGAGEAAPGEENRLLTLALTGVLNPPRPGLSET